MKADKATDDAQPIQSKPFVYDGVSGEEYARSVGQQSIEHIGYALQSRKFVGHLKTGDDVLDFGCGNGSLAKEIRPFVANIDGLEVNAFTRELAKTHGALKVYASLDEIERDKKYDVIYTNHVLEHLENVIETLRALSKHLKPGGRLMIVVPAEDFRSAPQKQWFVEDADRHLHTWTPRLMANTLRQAGLIPKEIELKSNAWVPQLFFLGNNWLLRAFCRLKGLLLKRHELFASAELKEI